MRRLFALLVPTACLVLVAFTLYLRRDQISRQPISALFQPHKNVETTSSAPSPSSPTKAPATTISAATLSVPTTTTPPHKDILPPETKKAYLNAILDPEATDLPRLHCPKLDTTRYEPLQVTTQPTADAPIQYFFAIDLRQCLPLLPRLIGSVVEAIRFLGSQHCALSIVEGNSNDGTGEVLAALRTELEALGAQYHFQTSTINPKKGDRIQKLAQLRNLALQPLYNPPAPTTYSPTTTTVIFLNDVAICPEDILELLHQRRFLAADMACAMDWTYVGEHPTFYDVWIARTIAGDAFFEIPPDGSWDSAWNLFWNEPGTLARFNARQPFQVFSCWNGAAVFTAAPLLGVGGEEGLRFRSTRKGECAQGEPQLFCKDLWWRGYGKIAVVPTVNLEYSDEKGERIKALKGYVSKWVGEEGYKDEGIEWQLEPPEKYKCTARYSDQFFEAWNKTQPGT